MKLKHLFIFTTLLSISLSCTTVKIASNTSRGNVNKLNNVYVLIQSEVKASKFSNSFGTDLMSAFKKYDIEGEFDTKNNLSFKTDENYLNSIKEFDPNQFIIVKQTAISYRDQNIIDAITLEINILNYPSNKSFWKGELDIYGQVGLKDAIRKSVKKLLKRLENDTLI